VRLTQPTIFLSLYILFEIKTLMLGYDAFQLISQLLNLFVRLTQPTIFLSLYILFEIKTLILLRDMVLTHLSLRGFRHPSYN